MDLIFHSFVEDFRISAVVADLIVDILPSLIFGQWAELVFDTDPIDDIGVLAAFERLSDVFLSDQQDLQRRSEFDR